MSIKWAVAFIGDDEKERLTLFNSDECHFSMCICVRWYSSDLSAAGDTKRLRFYAARPVFFDENGRPLSTRFVSIVMCDLLPHVTGMCCLLLCRTVRFVAMFSHWLQTSCNLICH